jgi:hypothetical protein
MIVTYLRVQKVPTNLDAIYIQVAICMGESFPAQCTVQ